MSTEGAEVNVTDSHFDTVRLCEHIALQDVRQLYGTEFECQSPDTYIIIQCRECNVMHEVSIYKE